MLCFVLSSMRVDLASRVVNVNNRIHPPLRWWHKRHIVMATIALLATVGAGCGPSIQRSLLYEKTVAIPPGRFSGTVEFRVPQRPKDSVRDYQYVVTMEAMCGPQLRISYPDGEVRKLGSGDSRWQTLLGRRAGAIAYAGGEQVFAPENYSQETAPPAPQPARGETPPIPRPAQGPTAGVPAPVLAPQPHVVAPPARGHWEQRVVEQWSGQVEFLRMQKQRCRQSKQYTRRYTTAFSQDDILKIWTDVPQEINNAKVTIRLYELINKDLEADIREQKQQKIARRERRAKRWSKEANTPRPPEPAPKNERPSPAVDPGATWSPGSWRWNYKGRWVWESGHWRRPQTSPGLLQTNHGAAPIVGCTWANGHWTWEKSDGSWTWHKGHWNPPPPRQERPGTPQVPEQPWKAGFWVKVGLTFRWQAGHWGRPNLRKETIPTPPRAGSKWHKGTWLKLRGRWIWSAGFYEGSQASPPPPKPEVASAPPSPRAVWLRGFWRWEVTTSSYRWVPGHWELPPGEGYVWVFDPVDPTTGFSISGQWKLQINIDTSVVVP